MQSRFCFPWGLGCCCSLICDVIFILENQGGEMRLALEAQAGGVCKRSLDSFCRI